MADQSPKHPSEHLAIVTEPISPASVAWLRERCEVIEAPQGSPAFEEHIGRATALVVRTYTDVRRPLLDTALNLKVVARAGVALDNIDVPACRDRGVEVVHAPGANSDAVAEYVFALIFDAIRPRLFLKAPLDQAGWDTWRKDLLAPRQLATMTMGVWGCGRIGSRVCRVARAFGMPRVVYHDIAEINRDARHGADPVSKQELCEQADIVTVHIDDRPANRHAVDTDAFGRMKSDVVFLNCARGLVVDPVAAAEFFVGHPAATGMFDVHDPEPFTETHPLLDIPNVHLAPHIAAATEPAKAKMSEVVFDVWRVLCNTTPQHPAPNAASVFR